MTVKRAAPAKRTEAEMLGLLRKRYAREGNGGSAEYAFLTHVRDEASFDAQTTIDALAVGLWKSRGFLMHAFEVKCSRSDWLRELKAPHKAEKICHRVDFFWLVVADASIVKDGELPATWGLLVAQGDRLVCEVEAPALRDLTEKPPISRSWLVCLLRAAGAALSSSELKQVTEARNEGFNEGYAKAEENVEFAREELNKARAAAAQARNELHALKQELTGAMSIDHDELVRLIRSVRDFDNATASARRQARYARDRLAESLTALDHLLAVET